MVPKEIIPSGYKQCTLCNEILKANKNNFHHSGTCRNNLNSRCKACSNKLRRQRWYSKSSHNVPCFCYYCGSFFYQAMLIINKIKKYQKSQFPKLYCGKECSLLDGNYGRQGKSWKGRRRGENNPNAILNSKQVIAIKKQIKKGIKNSEICDLFKIKPAHVSRIKSERIWAHIKV